MLINRESTCASPLFDRSLRITEIRGQEDYGSSRNLNVTKRSNTDVREKKRDNHGNGLSRDQKIMYLAIVLLRDTLVKISVEIMTKRKR